MKFLHAWFLFGFAFAVSLQAVPKPLYEKGGGFVPDERVLYKQAFGKKEKVAEELNLEFFYPEGFAKTDSRSCLGFFFGGGWFFLYRLFCLCFGVLGSRRLFLFSFWGW